MSCKGVGAHGISPLACPNPRSRVREGSARRKVPSSVLEPVVVKRQKSIIQPVSVPRQEVQALLRMSGHALSSALPHPSAAADGKEVALERLIGVIHPNRPTLRSAHDQQRHDAAAVVGNLDRSQMAQRPIVVGSSPAAFFGRCAFPRRQEERLRFPTIADPFAQRIWPAGVLPQGVEVIGFVTHLVAAQGAFGCFRDGGRRTVWGRAGPGAHARDRAATPPMRGGRSRGPRCRYPPAAGIGGSSRGIGRDNPPQPRGSALLPGTARAHSHVSLRRKSSAVRRAREAAPVWSGSNPGIWEWQLGRPWAVLLGSLGVRHAQGLVRPSAERGRRSSGLWCRCFCA